MPNPPMRTTRATTVVMWPWASARAAAFLAGVVVEVASTAAMGKGG